MSSTSPCKLEAPQGQGACQVFTTVSSVLSACWCTAYTWVVWMKWNSRKSTMVRVQQGGLWCHSLHNHQFGLSPSFYLRPSLLNVCVSFQHIGAGVMLHSYRKCSEEKRERGWWFLWGHIFFCYSLSCFPAVKYLSAATPFHWNGFLRDMTREQNWLCSWEGKDHPRLHLRVSTFPHLLQGLGNGLIKLEPACWPLQFGSYSLAEIISPTRIYSSTIDMSPAG